MNNDKVCIVGLGYVGLPLAIEFGKKYETIGYDIDEYKIDNYIKGIDKTGEITYKQFKDSTYLKFTNDETNIQYADFIIIAVPTPIYPSKIPDFGPLISATEIVAKSMKVGSTIIYESTVFPYATRDICIPIIENTSRLSILKWKENFNIAYSPERINPGDKEHTLTKVIKIVSGDTEETLKKVKDLYSSIINAGIYEASSIEVAESAKIIENIQRDVNIALMNELSIIFNKLNIDTKEVLDAAQTKWNFLDFTPGLVGGHCIGVDPYYLTFKSEQSGYHPEMILAGRRINDGMAKYIVYNVIKKLVTSQCNICKTTIAIFGLTFKCDCSDLRNTKVFDIIKELNEFGPTLHIVDPYIKQQESMKYQINMTNIEDIKDDSLDVAIIAVNHSKFKQLNHNFFISKIKKSGWIFDIKSILDKNIIREMGINYWRL